MAPHLRPSLRQRFPGRHRKVELSNWLRSSELHSRQLRPKRNILAYTAVPNGSAESVQIASQWTFSDEFQCFKSRWQRLSSRRSGPDRKPNLANVRGTTEPSARVGDVFRNITVIGTHHDFVMLPNGHLVVIAATQEVISGTTVTGEVLIDPDQNHIPSGGGTNSITCTPTAGRICTQTGRIRMPSFIHRPTETLLFRSGTRIGW
jgi:hypothetical protein